MQHPDLVDEFVVVLFEFDLDHLPREIALDDVQHRAQRQYLAGLQGLARPFVVALVGQAGHGAGGQRERQRAGRQDKTAAFMPDHAVFRGRATPGLS
ncbi:hypothetical protein D9M69_696500 [compost metagenome]